MRIQATGTTISWIPSESVTGSLRLGFDLKLSHWDQPLPEQLRRTAASSTPGSVTTPTW